MVLWSIAVKNFKDLAKNYLLLFFLILIPLMQIYLISDISQNAAQGGIDLQEGFVELITLTSGSSDLLQTFTAGILVQFLLITSMIAGATIVAEREQNTMMRIYAAPVSKIKMLTGILLGHSATVLMITSIIIVSSFKLFDVSWGDSWINTMIVTLMGVFVGTAMSFLISAIFNNPKIAGGIMSIVVIGMTFMSGGLIQTDKLDTVSKFTINKWIAESYITLAQGGGLQDIIMNLTIIALIGTVLILTASFLYRREDLYE
ncbi:ABC transporter permease [Alkaliphilus hydrothermalis]|uniref:ABC-2 type transport system permease protein n=1 Tax=Alkaliphilus hydrothermalis TaxID=1482730 RepID=A0ABS2NSZ6_9FIRM|nr:ABC transporter permease [Alkaliphilus hydrothermalis]MBM7615699.1 ABC-2 type transport system permease protein [Alkaliphilus hydrothermalis]